MARFWWLVVSMLLLGWFRWWLGFSVELFWCLLCVVQRLWVVRLAAMVVDSLSLSFWWLLIVVVVVGCG